MKKRVVSAMLAVAMVGSLMAACNQKPGGGDTGGGNEVPNYDEGELYANAKMSDEPIYPTMTLRTDETYTAETEAYQWIGEITNIYFQPQPIPLSSYDEKMGSIMAGGDYPDMHILRLPAIAKEYGPEGAFVNMTEKMKNGYMPNLKKVLENSDSDAFLTLKATDGNIYGAPRVYTYDMLHESYLARTDLMEEWGFGERFESHDELYEFLVKCKEEYPDSTPMGSKWGANTLFNGIGHQFDAWIDLAYLDPADNETYVAGPLKDGFEDMITFMNKCYTNGLLDPEWATCSDEQYMEKILNNKIMFSFNYMTECDEMTANGKQTNPDFEWTPTIPPAEGGRMEYGIADCYKRVYQTLKVVHSDSEYIDQLIQFIDWTYSKEGSDVINYGKVGETFNYDDEGNVVLNENVKTALNPAGTIDFTELGVGAEWTSLETEEGEALKSAGPIALKAMEEHRAVGAVMDPRPNLTFDADQTSKKNDLSAPLTTYRDEMMYSFTTGQTPLSEFENFRNTLIEMGINDLVALYQEVYDNYIQQGNEL